MQASIRAKSAWASLLKPDFRPESSSTLLTSQIVVNNGTKSFTIDPEKVADDKLKWTTAIIGQVMGNNSSYFNMKQFAEHKWSTKGLLEVQRIDESLFVFRFQSEDSKQEILEQSPLPFGNRVLFLWPWSLDKPIQKLQLNAVPVWVKLPNLRPHYFNSHVLSGLGSIIGKPLFMDKLTTSQSRVAYARICVEINADEAPPASIKFTDENGKECMQEVQYEWMPSRCPSCKTFGHNCEMKNKLNGQEVAKQQSMNGQVRGRQQQRTEKVKNKRNEETIKTNLSGPTHKLQQIKDAGADMEVNLTEEQCARMEKLMENIEASSPVTSKSLATGSGRTSFTREAGHSGNKFQILTNMDEDAFDKDCLSDGGKNSQEEKSEGKKIVETSQVLGGVIGEQNESSAEDSSSNEDSIDTSVPLNLIVKSSTKPKILHPNQEAISSPPTSPSHQASPLREENMPTEADPIVSNKSKKLQPEHAYIDQTTDEDLLESEKETTRTRQSSRGATRGRPRGRGHKLLR